MPFGISESITIVGVVAGVSMPLTALIVKHKSRSNGNGKYMPKPEVEVRFENVDKQIVGLKSWMEKIDSKLDALLIRRKDDYPQ